MKVQEKVLVLGILSLLAGCSSSSPVGRSIAQENAIEISGDAVDEALKQFKLQAYFANFHAHHYMPEKNGGGINSGEEEAKTDAEDFHHYPFSPQNVARESRGLASEDAERKRPSAKKGFQDDGVPFRDNTDLSLEDVVMENLQFAGITKDHPEFEALKAKKLALGELNYFEHACLYAVNAGGLDIQFITPHTKKADPGPNARQQDTIPAEFSSRRELLKSINAQFKGKRFCGLGQEASSISAGNHLGIFGSNPLGKSSSGPVYFDSGDFAQGFSRIGERVTAGEKIFLQMNHPEARADLGASFDADKNSQNDYGLDDFAPAGCVAAKHQLARIEGLKKLLPMHKEAQTKFQALLGSEACAEAKDAQFLSNEILRKTFANINQTTGGAFRLIETLTPDGATSNDSSSFKRSHDRRSASVRRSDLEDWEARESRRVAEIVRANAQNKEKLAKYEAELAAYNESPKGKKKPKKPKIGNLKDESRRQLTKKQKVLESDRSRLNGPYTSYYFSKPDGSQAIFGNLLGGTYDYLFYLNMGLKLAPSANQDNHLSNWGSATANRTGVLAADLRESSIVEAIDKRRAYATEDKNARVVFYTSPSDDKEDAHLMGDSYETSADHVTLKVAYRDSSPEDKFAGIRIYRYKTGESLPWAINQGEVQNGRYQNPMLPDDPQNVIRLVSFKPSPINGVFVGEIPQGPPSPNSTTMLTWTSDEDPTVSSGGEVVLRLQLEKGEQFVVAELTQKQDFDRIYTAPIWITKK